MRIRRQRGMNLLEVVVSMLIIGIVLAMSVSMIQTSVRFGESAAYTSAAQMQAQSLVDKIRVNASAAKHYMFQESGINEQKLRHFAKATEEEKSALYRSINMQSLQNCERDCKTPELLAKADIQSWQSALEDSLPLPRFQLLPSDLGHENYLLAIFWSYNSEDALSAERRQEKYGNDLRIGGIVVPFSL
ncbi:MAG: prepilin-type N-terminal cleavage/methylation domain-containing protein [Cardiobacteriaceae bacterium]|nr:prepilin-type N-terminal cleavage/methylation domain-containing protein [Cardiobacteriaceae bacterium]